MSLRARRDEVHFRKPAHESLAHDIVQLTLPMPVIGTHTIDQPNIGALQPWIDRRRTDGKTSLTTML